MNPDVSFIFLNFNFNSDQQKITTGLDYKSTYLAY